MPAAPRDHWFEDLADHLGGAYLRYSFTKGTEQEVSFLVEALGLEPNALPGWWQGWPPRQHVQR